MTPSSLAIATVESYLQRVLRICISDNRIFLGTFVCMDKQLNIILTNTEEFRLGGSSQGRFVGMVMVPWKQITKLEVQGADLYGGFEDEYT